MQTSKQGRELIERNEGCVLHAYRDVVGVLTIGYGCTGRGIYEGMTITQSQADQMLSDRLSSEFDPGVNKAAKFGPSNTQNQFDAMISLEFNIGIGAFSKSSVVRYHNLGNYKQAANSFLLWNKAGGRVLAALIRRRNEERNLYLLGVIEDNTKPKEVNIIKAPIIPQSAHIRNLMLKTPYLTGDDVTELQHDLKIKEDGIYGPVTNLAVMSFQLKSNLKVDGIVGANTWLALNRI